MRSSLTSVNDLLLDTVNGGHARLGSLAQVSVAPAPQDITHDAMSPYVDVTAGLSGRSLSSAKAAMASGLSGISFPLGYYAVVQDAPGNPAFSGARLVSYVVAALIGILLLAQAATGSWRLALVVLGALPVPVAAGVLIAFRIGAQDSLAAMAGLLAVLAIAIQQSFRVTAAIRRAHLADGGHADARRGSGRGSRRRRAIVHGGGGGRRGARAVHRDGRYRRERTALHRCGGGSRGPGRGDAGEHARAPGGLPAVRPRPRPGTGPGPDRGAGRAEAAGGA